MKPQLRWMWLAYAAALWLAPLLWRSGFAHTLLAQMGVAVMVCLSYAVLLGQGGLLSFGHAVYVGAGAYAAMFLLNALEASASAFSGGWPAGALSVMLLPLLAGLGAALLALPLGWLSTRQAGTPFAMITLGVGELVWAVALMFPSVFGGEAGIAGNRVLGVAWGGFDLGPTVQLYYVIAVYVLAATALVYGFTRTTLGTVLNAVRDNPQRVGFLGYDARTVRLIACVLAAFVAGVAGGLSALLFERVTPDVFNPIRSGTLLLFTYVGGATLLAGPVVGGVLMVLALVWLSTLTPAWLLYVGLLFMVVVMAAPDGVAGWLQRAWQRGWPRLTGYLIARALAWGGVLVSLVLLVEMAYQQQLSAAVGPVLTLGWGSLQINTAHAGPWWVALAVGVAGAGVLWALHVWHVFRGRSHG